MILRLLLALLLLSLTACGMRTVKDASPANDLDVLLLNVTKDGQKIRLPNGRQYCAELARSQDEQDDCMGDLEDALFNANMRGERIVTTVANFVAREKLRRNPCTWWERARRVDRCRVQ